MVKNRSVKESGIITDVPNAARNYKDRIFRMVFREKKALLALYNAMNETDYENEDDLKVTTLESALYLEMKSGTSAVSFASGIKTGAVGRTFVESVVLCRDGKRPKPGTGAGVY